MMIRCVHSQTENQNITLYYKSERRQAMVIKNARVYTAQKTFAYGEICMQNDVFATETDNSAAIDAGGCYAIPGLIDMHFHGCMGYDICDGTQEAIAQIAGYEASVGVTAIAPATMTPEQAPMDCMMTFWPSPPLLPRAPVRPTAMMAIGMAASNTWPTLRPR